MNDYRCADVSPHGLDETSFAGRAGGCCSAAFFCSTPLSSIESCWGRRHTLHRLVCWLLFGRLSWGEYFGFAWQVEMGVVHSKAEMQYSLICFIVLVHGLSVRFSRIFSRNDVKCTTHTAAPHDHRAKSHWRTTSVPRA